MEKLTNLHKTALRILIELQGSPFSNECISQEKLISLLHFIASENTNLYSVINDLLELGVIQVKDLCTNTPSYAVTQIGRIVDEKIQMPAGVTVEYDDLLYTEYTDESLEDEVWFVETFFINWVGEFVHVLADRLYEHDDLVHEDLLHENLFFCKEIFDEIDACYSNENP